MGRCLPAAPCGPLFFLLGCSRGAARAALLPSRDPGVMATRYFCRWLFTCNTPSPAREEAWGGPLTCSISLPDLSAEMGDPSQETQLQPQTLPATCIFPRICLGVAFSGPPSSLQAARNCRMRKHRRCIEVQPPPLCPQLHWQQSRNRGRWKARQGQPAGAAPTLECSCGVQRRRGLAHPRRGGSAGSRRAWTSCGQRA